MEMIYFGDHGQVPLGYAHGVMAVAWYCASTWK